MNIQQFSLALLTVTSLTLTGCADSKSTDGLTFKNDMETLIAWTDNHPSNVLYFNNAHSGKYVCLIDSSNTFGVTFNMKNKDVNPSPLKKIIVGAWFNSQQNGCEPILAIDIRDKDGNTIDWISHPAKDQLKTTGVWEWVEMAVDLTPKNRNAIENTCRVYAFNKSGSGCLVDDMEIRYEK